MSAKIIRLMTAQETSAAGGMQSRTPGAVLLLRELRSSGLTQEQAARLIGRDSRQLRKWLKKAPPVLELIAALQNTRKVAA